MMIKIVFLMRRKADVPFDKFSDHWLNSHANLVKRHAAKLGIRRYVQSHVVGPAVAVALRGQWNDEEPYDGMAEVWLDGLDTVLGTPGDPEMAAVQEELMRDENTFVDRERSSLFITEDHVIIG